MVKRIEKQHVRVGMYIESMEGFWRDSPFPEGRFLLKRESDVARIKTSSISGVFINTARGIDIDGTRRHSPRSTPQEILAPDTVLELQRRPTANVTRSCAQRLKGVFAGVCHGGAIDTATITSIVDTISAEVKNNPRILLDVTRLKTKDLVTFLHSIAVSALLVNFGRSLGYDPDIVRVLGVAGLVHDIGKLSIPSKVLNKAGALAPDEVELIKQHPSIGHDMLARQGGFSPVVLEITRYHHERMDGTGYPDKVRAETLSTFVRMSAICDVYEALTTLRPYKRPWSSSDALSWMLARPDHFDQALLWKFIFSLDASLTQGVV